MRVLVTGGQDFMDMDVIARTLARFKPVPWNAVSEHIIIHGGCSSGTDKLVDEWCDVFGVRKRVYLAQCDRDGRAAGPIRNSRMIAMGKPDLVVAFPGGRGTTDCVRKAEAAGIPVQRVPASPALVRAGCLMVRDDLYDTAVAVCAAAVAAGLLMWALAGWCGFSAF